jgi:hypothetical protein
LAARDPNRVSIITLMAFRSSILPISLSMVT